MERIRTAVKLPDLKFHDLRKTFASLLAQRGVSTTVIQRLLEHSSPQLTNDVYTNVDPVLRDAINLLPVADWMDMSGSLRRQAGYSIGASVMPLCNSVWYGLV